MPGLRVIGGESRGRRLKAPRGLATRPTLARIRESIFSRLAARMDISGLKVLDLFAGTGSLGIEALSRGAATVTFVDNARAATSVIEHNLEQLGLKDRGRILESDVYCALSRLSDEGEKFDLIFLDPPYARGFGDKVMADLVGKGLLKNDSWIATEVSKREHAPGAAGLERVNIAVVGDHQIVLLRPLGAGQTE